jgi:uncharacterized protein (DUF2141 family)
MGCISGFGIKCAALTLVSAIGIATLSGAVEAAPGTATIDINIQGLRSAKGNVLVCVTANPKYFPDCGKDPKSYRSSVPARTATSVSFTGINPGTYAVALHHDENANSKMDMAVFVPREGFGFSRNPAVVTGPPKFKAAAFSVNGAEVSQTVKMKYMF